MLGLNWVDLVIIVLLGLAVVEGVRLGLLTQLLCIVGFFGTLFVAGWLFPHLLPIHDRTARTVINATCVLVAASAVAVVCADLGQGIHWSFRLGKLRDGRKLKAVETVLGTVPALLAGLALTWLLGVAIGRMPFQGFSNSVSDSRIVQTLTRELPPVPAVFADFDRQIDPNAQPYVFAQPPSQPSFDYVPGDVQVAEAKAVASVVRITSFSCGGIVSGTGFAIGSHLVATDAHVIAGSSRPIIKYQSASYIGTPVYFDPNLDLSILRVPGISLPALPLGADNVPLDTTVAVLGYPGGNYLAVPAIIRDTRAVSARSIYDQGSAGRGIYLLQTDVSSGSSGSPVVLASGQVAGIMFSKATDVSNVAYALTSSYIASALHQSQHSTRRVNTGACMVN